MNPTLQTETSSASNAVRTAHPRAGHCNRRASALRPISSSYPAQFKAAQSETKGFLLAGGRHQSTAL